MLNWIGIIDQLSTTQANRVLETVGLPMPQFVVLSHFARHPEVARTVTGVAQAFQQPQPGMTKTLQKLQEKGFIRAEPDPDDARSKRMLITPAGLDQFERAKAMLEPGLVAIFEGWSEPEIETLLGLLDRLRVFLDENRNLASLARGISDAA